MKVPLGNVSDHLCSPSFEYLLENSYKLHVCGFHVRSIHIITRARRGRRQDCVFGLFYLGKLCAVIMLTEIFIFSEEKEAQERKTQRQEKEEKE